MGITKILLLACLLFTSAREAGNQALPDKIAGKVISVKDGDTIEILFNGKPFSVRLAHVDCPELKRSQPFGKAAKQFTSAMCFGQEVTIENNNKFDRYKRLIGVLINEHGQNVNKELLKAGLAWHFKKYSSDQVYAALEIEARGKRVGLWADDNPIAPWNGGENRNYHENNFILFDIFQCDKLYAGDSVHLRRQKCHQLSL